MIISTPQLTVFFLILARIAGIFIQAPILNSKSIPFMIKSALAIWISLVLWFVVPVYQSLPATLPLFLGTLIFEVAFGFAIGFLCNIIFIGIQAGGEIIDMQMGLSVANVLDPQSELQVSIIASFKSLLATLLFVTIDGHHWFFEALATSYEKIPLGGFNFYSGAKMDFLLRLTSEIFVLGLQLSGPILVALLLANLFLGLMARSIPQLNVFVVGFPLTIGMGFILLVVGMPYMVTAMLQIFQKTGSGIIELMNMMAK